MTIWNIIQAGIIIAGVTIATIATSPATPSSKAKAYENCLSRLIATRGFRYAVNHAGSTICDRSK
jgi:hypothetical protein